MLEPEQAKQSTDQDQLFSGDLDTSPVDAGLSILPPHTKTTIRSHATNLKARNSSLRFHWPLKPDLMLRPILARQGHTTDIDVPSRTESEPKKCKISLSYARP